MARFKKKPEAPAEVTLERIAQSLQSKDINHQLFESEDGHPATLFVPVDDVQITIMLDGGWLWVSGKRFDTPLTQERGPEVLGWLNSFMSSTRFGTGVVTLDADTGCYDLHYNTYFPVEEGLHDDQLDEYILAGVNCVLDGVVSFCSHFQIPVTPG